MKEKKALRFLAPLLAALILPSIAGAASFDCTKAATPREKLICVDPALSALDDKLDLTYKKQRALLSTRGAEQLHRSQLSWLHYIGMVCNFPMPEKGSLGQTPVDCLKREYQTRLEQLSKAGQKLGSFVFNRIDLFSAEPDSDDDDGSRSGFYIQHVSYPQIDNNDSPLSDAWNKRVFRKLPLDGDCGAGDYDENYDIQYANKNFISTAWPGGEYCHGAAHGMGWSKVENLVLYPDLHELKTSDVFGIDDAWVAKFQDLVWKALQEQKWAPPKGQEDIKEQLLDEVIKPDRWAFTNEGIQISFGSYEGGCYACTPKPINLSWKELKPLMAPDSVVP